jgi:hypothetical protein
MSRHWLAPASWDYLALSRIPYFTVLGRKALFVSSNELWVTDGTSSGTSQVTTLTLADFVPVFEQIADRDFTVLGSEALFQGEDPNDHISLRVTDGTSARTSELAVANAYSGSLFSSANPDFTVLGSKVLRRRER